MNPASPTLSAANDIRHGTAAARIETSADATWLSALLLAETPAPARAALLDGLVDRAEAAPVSLRARMMDDLVQHMEVAAPPTRQRLAEAYIAGKAGGQETASCGLAMQEEVRRVRLRLAEAARPEVAERYPPMAVVPSAGGGLRVAIVVPQFLSAPSFLQPPLCGLLAAAGLREAGHEVLVLDNRVDKLPLAGLAARLGRCDVIAVITTPYDHIQNYFLDYRLRYACRTVDALKQAYPGTPVIVCGAHGSVRPDILFRDTLADYVVRGEFDTALPDLVGLVAAWEAPGGRADLCARGDRLPPPGPQGAVTPHRLIDLGPRFRGRTVEGAALRPAYDLVNLDAYFGDLYDGVMPQAGRSWATALATRGCAHDCSFCFNFWGRRVRYRDPRDMAEELAWLERRLNIHHVFFLDFHFTQDPDWVMAFADEVARLRLTIRWSAQARCDAVPDTLLDRMAAANCHGLWFGVETFDAGVAAALDKYRDQSAATRAIAGCTRRGIKPHLFLMVGLPGETRRSLNTTIREMHRHKAAFCGVMPATPRFGTEHYRAAKAEFDGLGDDFYSLRAVRGLVGNALRPSDLQDAMAIMNDRRFIGDAVPPQLPLG